jgi:hypothetical protein
MSSRAQELWHHRETGETYIVETEGERVVATSGPLDEDERSDAARAYKQAAQARTPGYGDDAADFERRRDEFERERLEAPR